MICIAWHGSGAPGFGWRAKSVALLVMYFLASLPAQAEQTCPPLQRIAKVPMNTESGGRITIPMTIAGHDANMLVDTGGVLTMITSRQVKALGLRADKNYRRGLVMFGGRVVDKTVRADIQLGSMKGVGRELFVYPDESTDVDGTLAPDTLRAFDVEFDFANASMNLFSQDHCPGRVVYWTDTPAAQIGFEIDPAGHIVVKVQLDGKDAFAIVDTGAYRSVMRLEVAERIFDFDKDDARLVKDKDDPTSHFPFKTLVIGGLTVNNPDLVLVPQSVSGKLDGKLQIILGMNVLRQLHLYVAYGEHNLYVTPASAR